MNYQEYHNENDYGEQYSKYGNYSYTNKYP